MKIIVQKWEESERGWGTRPDGVSFHLSEADRLSYIAKYWDRMPPTAPSEYSRPCGTPFEVDESEIPALVINQIDSTGYRYYGEQTWKDPGIDGWVRR